MLRNRKHNRHRPHQERLTPALLFIIYGFLSLSIVVLASVYYRNYEQNYRTAVEYQLSAVNKLKLAELSQWREERFSDAALLFNNPHFTSLFRSLFRTSETRSAQAALRAWCENFLIRRRYIRILLLDTRGDVMLAVPKLATPVPMELQNAIISARTMRDITFLDLHREEPGGRILQHLLIPILSEQENAPPLGTVVMDIDPALYLYPLLKNRPFPSSSAETMLVRRDGDRVVVLNDLHGIDDAALRLRFSLTQTDNPAVKAVWGQKGIVEGTDYRGEPVLAAIRAVPDTPWFMCTSQDLAEVYGPVRTRLLEIIILGAVILFGAGTGMLLLWRRQRERAFRERYHAAEKLHALSARQQALLESLPDIILETDRNGIYLWMNEQARGFFGEELIGREASFTVTSAGSPSCPFTPLLEGNKRFLSFESRERRADGSERLLSWRCRTLEDENGVVSGALASARDITEPTAAVTKLAETQRLLQSVIEQSPVPMVVAAPDGTITIFNQACRDLLGIDDEPEPNTGINLYTMRRTWQDLDPAGNPIPLQDLPLAAALRGEHVRHREMKVQRKDGSIRWEIVDGVPVYAHDGTLIAGLIIFPDITDRKLAEENIANERERLAVTLRSIGDGVITTDTQGKITIMNKVAEDLTGWTLADALGKPLETVFTIIDERTRTPRENPVSRVLSSGQIIELANHTLLVGQDGSERVIADSGAPIRDSTGHTIGVVLVFRDMTEKRKLLDHLQRADKLDSLGILAGGIAHDFNNLLSGIFGYIELARELSTTDDPIRPFLDQALGVFDRATNLTRQLITFSKGGTPVRKIQPIGTLLQNSLRFALSGSQVTNTVAIARDLWPCHFDEHQIAQVVDNLAINALQAMPEGGTISLIAENCLISGNKHPGLSPGRYVKITISDSGIGIPPEIRNRIFDPFFTTREKGNGLGLAVCYSIMQKHDGTIEADSVPGKGATFTLYLPAADSPPPPHAKKTAPRHRGKGRIIIMDDESSVRKVAGGMLSSMGYEPVEARDSDEMFRILAAARQESPPVRALILDLTIPGGKGGKAVVVEVNRKYPDIPVFVTSGYSDDPVMASPTEYGFTGSIKKPFRLNDLAALLEQHLTK